MTENLTDYALISIDPGVGGGMALFVGGKAAEAFAFTGTASASEWAQCVKARNPNVEAVIEQVQGCIGPHQPGKTMFTFGENFGWWQGVLCGLAIPFSRVRPQEWQRGMPGVAKLKGADRKRALREIAHERFPHLKPTLKTADALLIGAWRMTNR